MEEYHANVFRNMQRKRKYRKGNLSNTMTSHHVVIDNAYFISVFTLKQKPVTVVSVVNVDKGAKQS